MNSNLLKAHALGMPFGTASNKLKKSLLLHLAQKLGMDQCFRCSNKIENVESFSIEHKKSWIRSENPKEAFFNLENIAFSHLACNVRASKESGGRSHGVSSTYSNGCRCDPCRHAHKLDVRYTRFKKRTSWSGCGRKAVSIPNRVRL